jgi:membrane protein DedA with SNARE-associated domain
MPIAPLIAKYGLLALFLGAGVEGEAIVVTGGILAHKGLVPLWGAMLASATGSCLVDQIWFFLGRHFRHYPWVRRQTGRPAFARALGFLERHPTAFIFGFRFIYGLRTVSPIAIGTTQVETRKFVLLNILAAAIWGPLFTLLGYAFGKAIDPVLHRFEAGALHVIGGLIVLVAIIALIVWLIRRRRRPAALGESADA